MEPDTALRSPAAGSATPALVRPWWSAGLVTALLLVALAIFAAPPTLDVEAAQRYHEAAHEAGNRAPFTIGPWVGSDVPVPTAAVDILKPNVLISRSFENMDTGERVGILIVQCTDSRDLAGHYPPVCYPAHGMVPGTVVAREWRIAGHVIPAMRYTFSEKDVTKKSVTVVDNFMVLPNGSFGRDMDEMRQIGKDRRLRQFGAAQVQLLTDGSMSDARRDAVFEQIVGVLVPVIEPFLGKVDR